MYGRYKLDNRNTGRTDLRLPANARETARYDGCSPVRSNAVGDGRRFWIGDTAGRLFCFSADLELEYSMELDSSIFATPVLSGNRIYAVTNGSVYALDTERSGIIWRKETADSGMKASPLIAAGHLYCVIGDHLHEIDPDTGRSTRTADVSGSFTAPSYHTPGDRILLVGKDGNLRGISRSEFQNDFSLAVAETFGGVSIDETNHLAWAACKNGILYRIDLVSGTLSGTAALSPTESSPSLDPAGNVYIASEDGGVYSFDPDGNPRWQRSFPGDKFYGHVVVDENDNICFQGSRGTLYCLCGEDGSSAWELDTGPSYYTSPFPFKNITIITADHRGIIRKIEPREKEGDEEGCVKTRFDVRMEADYRPSETKKPEDGDFIFDLLADFWEEFEDRDFLKVLWSSYQGYTLDYLVYALQLGLSHSLFDTAPALRRKFKRIDASQRTVEVKVEASNRDGTVSTYPVTSIPYLVDRFDSPAVRLEEGTDYSIKNGVLTFEEEPPVKHLWAVDYRVDYGHIYRNFGFLVGLKKEDMLEAKDEEGETIPVTPDAYLKAVRTLWHAFFSGPTEQNLRNALNAVLGLPIARKAGTLSRITTENDGGKSGVKTIAAGYGDEGEVFSNIPSGLRMAEKPDGTALKEGDPLSPYQALTDGAVILDRVNTPDFHQHLYAYLRRFRSYFFDDFNGLDLNAWTIEAGESWSAANGILTGADNTGAQILKRKGDVQNTRNVEAGFQIRETPYSDYLNFRILLFQTADYFFCAGCRLKDSLWTIEKIDRNNLENIEVLMEGKTKFLYRNQFYVLKAVVRNTDVYLYGDGELIGSLNLSDYPDFSGAEALSGMLSVNTLIKVDYFQDCPEYRSYLPSREYTEEDLAVGLSFHVFLASISANTVSYSHFSTTAVRQFLNKIKPTWKSYILTILKELAGDVIRFAGDEFTVDTVMELGATIQKYGNPVSRMDSATFEDYTLNPEYYPEYHLGIDSVLFGKDGLEIVIS